jgi:hypothetical protein
MLEAVFSILKGSWDAYLTLQTAEKKKARLGKVMLSANESLAQMSSSLDKIYSILNDHCKSMAEKRNSKPNLNGLDIKYSSYSLRDDGTVRLTFNYSNAYGDSKFETVDIRNQAEAIELTLRQRLNEWLDGLHSLIGHTSQEVFPISRVPSSLSFF